MAKTWGELLVLQEGVLARRQALRAGMTRHEWAWKLTSGRWQSPLPGVAIAHSGGTTDRELAWAAVLYGGKDALLSGDAALVQWGVKVERLKALDLAIPVERVVTRQRVEHGPEVRVHRVTGLRPLGRILRDLPLTNPHTAVLHAAAWAATDRDAEHRVAASVQRRITAVPLLRSALACTPMLKRHALVSTVLDDVSCGAHAGSELQYLRFCRTHGVPRPDELQLRLRVGATTHYLDARYVRQRVTVELDGAHHATVEAWQADALRSLRIAAALPGEQILRLTPGMLRHDGPEVAALLHKILA